MGTGYYMKFADGQNKFRVLSDAITGYEVWAGGKPVRTRDYPKTMPEGFDSESGVKHFWAMVVWNYQEEAVQILEITQASVRNAIHDIYTIEEFGEPQGYDLVVSRKGEKLNTEYSVQALPPKPMAESIRKAYESKKVRLEALFDGGNPFEESALAEIKEILEEEPPAKMPPPPKSVRR